MLIGIVCGVAFLGILLMAWNACRGLDLNSQDGHPPEPVRVSEEPLVEGHCVLCGAQLRCDGATSDDVVFELERRIGDDVSVVMQTLAKTRGDDLRRLYLS